MAFTKIADADFDGRDVSSAPDRLTGTAAENKAVFDRAIKQVVQTAFNALVGELEAPGGASCIGASVEGVQEDSVGGVLTALKTLVDLKADAEDGKGLSANDFTDGYKAALDNPTERVGECSLSESGNYLFIDGSFPDRGALVIEVPSSLSGTPYILVSVGTLGGSYVTIATTQRGVSGSAMTVKLDYEIIGDKLYGRYAAAVGSAGGTAVCADLGVQLTAGRSSVRIYGSTPLPSGTKATLYRRNY